MCLQVCLCFIGSAVRKSNINHKQWISDCGLGAAGHRASGRGCGLVEISIENKLNECDVCCHKMMTNICLCVCVCVIFVEKSTIFLYPTYLYFTKM